MVSDPQGFRIPSQEPRPADRQQHSGRTAARSPNAPRCEDEESQAFLVPYAISSCTDHEAEVFEAHLLGCDRCFDDVQCLDRAGELIRDYLESGAPTKDRFRGSVRQALRASIQRA